MRGQPEVDALDVVHVGARRQQLRHGADPDGAEADRALRRASAVALAAVPDEPVVHERWEKARRHRRHRERPALLRVPVQGLRAGVVPPAAREVLVQREEAERGGDGRGGGVEEEEAVRRHGEMHSALRLAAGAAVE